MLTGAQSTRAGHAVCRARSTGFLSPHPPPRLLYVKPELDSSLWMWDRGPERGFGLSRSRMDVAWQPPWSARAVALHWPARRVEAAARSTGGIQTNHYNTAETPPARIAKDSALSMLS